MSGPWENYQPTDDGPWAKYAGAPAPAAAPAQQDTSVADHFGNFAAGAVRGAGSIGATIMSPIDWLARQAGVQNDYIGRTDRRDSMTQALGDSLGFDTDSKMFGAGKLAGEVAGTAGVGGAMANGVRALNGVRGMAGLEPIINGAARGLETGGFRVGELAGTGLGTATRAATGAITGGAAAGMVSPSDAPTGALIGGVLPAATQLAGSAAGMIRRGLGAEVAPEVRTLAQRAKTLGIDIPADRLVDSRPLNAVASSLNYVPFSGRAATEDRMLTQLNKALSRTFGQDSPNVTAALRNADGALGAKFDSALSRGVAFDQQLLDDVANVYNKAEQELGSDALKPIASKINELIAKGESGMINGQAAYNIKRDLDRIGRSDAPNAWHALELKGKLMDALNRTLGPDAAAAFEQTRKQYGAMLTLQKLAKRGAEGEVSAARLANMPKTGNADIEELANIAAQFVKPREGAHGAAQRVFGAGGALTLGGAGAMVGGPAGMVMAPAAVSAAGRAANSVLNADATRNLLLRQPRLFGEVEPIGLFTRGASGTLPLLAAQ